MTSRPNIDENSGEIREPAGGQRPPLARGEMLLQLTAVFEKEKIPYCLMGDTRGLPDAIPGDVDFAVAQSSLVKVPGLLLRFCEGHQARLVQVMQHELTAFYFTLAWTGPGGQPQFLNPDICGDYYRTGRLYLNSEELLASRALGLEGARSAEGFYVAGAEANFIYYLIKKIDKRDLSNRSGAFLGDLWRSAPGENTRNIRRFWPEPEATLLAKAAQNNAWAPIIARLPGFQRALRKQRPFSTRVAFLDLARKLRRALQPTGLMVVVMGPDGAGKSSVIDAVQASLAPAFRRTRRVHLRPHLGRTTDVNGTVEANPHGKNAYGWLISLLKLVYLWFDYTVGYWLKIYPQVARSTLVMFDRYYQDLLVDPRRYRFGGSRLLAGFFGKILPQPNIWIFLDAPANVLQERKREVSPQETARQREAYRMLAATLPGAFVVDASQNLEQVVAQVDEAILGWLAARARQRLPSSRYPG